MNPFSRANNTLTAISVSVTNIRSLSTTVAGATYKKITRMLDLKSEVNVLIDTFHISSSIDEHIHFTLQIKHSCDFLICGSCHSSAQTSNVCKTHRNGSQAIFGS